MYSLRSRLITSLLLGVGVLLILAGLLLSKILTASSVQDFDQALEAKARALVTLTKDFGHAVELDFAGEMMPEFETEILPEYFQLWIDGDEILERSNSLLENDLSRLPADFAEVRLWDVELPDGRSGRQIQIDFIPQVEDDDIGDEILERSDSLFENDLSQLPIDFEEVRLGDVEFPDGRSGRQIQIDFIPQVEDDEAEDAVSKHRVTLAVAKERTSLDQKLRFLHLVLTGVAFLTIAAVAVLVGVVTPNALRPLDDLASQVEALDPQSLSDRVHIPKLPSELKPPLDKLNDLLVRFEEAFERERRLSSDIAHELRTPVAELRNLSAVGMRLPENREAVLKFFNDVQEISLQMEGAIADLLALARLEGGIDRLDLDEIRLRRLIEETWSTAAADSRRPCLGFDLDVDDDLRLQSDREKIRRILENLLTNAASYGREDGTVQCHARRFEDHVLLKISNPTDNLAPEDLEPMFQRFWRKDTARTSRDSAGLGMALVKAYAEALQIDLRVDLVDDAFSIELILPV